MVTQPHEIAMATVCAGLRDAMRADSADDTVRLVYADWLEENGHSEAAARLRWWVEARAAATRRIIWDRPTTWADVRDAIDRLPADWVRRLYAVHLVRLTIERYPLHADHTATLAAARHALAVAEEYALLLASTYEAAYASYRAGSIQHAYAAYVAAYVAADAAADAAAAASAADAVAAASAAADAAASITRSLAWSLAVALGRIPMPSSTGG